MTNNLRRARRVAGALLLTATGLSLGAASPASAASASTCGAAALQLSVLGTSVVTPIQAGLAGNASACTDADGSFDTGLLGAVAANAVQATTRVVDKTTATASSQVAGLKVGLGGFTGALTAPLLTGPHSLLGQVNAQLGATIQTGGSLRAAIAPLEALGLTVTGVDSTQVSADVAADLPAALQASLPDLVDADLLSSTAKAVCVDGKATLEGGSDLTNVSVLGTTIDADDAANTALTLDSEHLSLAQLESVSDVLRSIKVKAAPASLLAVVLGTGETNLYDLLVTPGGLLGAVNALLPVGTTLSTLLTTVDSVLRPVLDNVQIAIPADLLHATVTPHVVTNDGDVLEASTLRLDVTAFGAPILSGDLAHSTVSAAAAGCVQSDKTPLPTPTAGPAPTPTPTNAPLPHPVPDPPTDPEREPATTPDPTDGKVLEANRYASAFAELQLRCTQSTLRLIDVRPSGRTTLVRGVAERQYIGKTATIYLAYGKKAVGTAKVGASGLFAARVPLPPSRIRSTNAARYYAVIEGRRTSALKFARRMMTSRLVAVGGTVTFQGYTTTPRAKSQAPVGIQQRVTCTQYKTVATTRPNGSGQFAVTFKAPKNESYAVYRAQTSVPKSARSKTVFPTFTLPQVLGLK